MNIYTYSIDTKEYLATEIAEKDPAETERQGKFIPLVPAYATLLKPLKAKEGYAVIFNNAWEYIKDNRGEKVINPDTEEIQIVDYLGELKEGFVDYEEYINSEEYKKKKAKEREDAFNIGFFNTSLGYIRREVTMANGDGKDFLSDLLPTIAMGVQLGQPVKIIAYNKPDDFSEEITDWTKYQHNELVTPQFIQECFVQLQNDFGTVKS